LFDQSGGAASGTKQDAVSSAGQMVMKLMMKNQMSGVSGVRFRAWVEADVSVDDGRRELWWSWIADGYGKWSSPRLDVRALLTVRPKGEQVHVIRAIRIGSTMMSESEVL